jgi:phosphate transport system substrate-binding protein
MKNSIVLLLGIIVTLHIQQLVNGTPQDIRSELSGTIEVDGSSTVAPISTAAASMFGEEYKKVKIPIGVSGTGGGFKRFTKGDIDISDASRPIKDAEFAACKEHNVEFIELPIAYDGLTIAVNKQNTWVRQLTVDQLKKIFLADAAVKTWDQLDPSWPKDQIKIFSPGTDSGTFDYFKEVVAGEQGSIRSDMSVSEDDNNLVQGIASTKSAIGFFGCAYYFENTDKLRAVPIVNASGKAVLPDSATIASGDYSPFSRPLFLYVNAKSSRRPEVKLFVKFYLENAADIADSVGYVGLPDEVSEMAAKHFENRLVGTHYWTQDGKRREGSLEEVYQESNLVK